MVLDVKVLKDLVSRASGKKRKTMYFALNAYHYYYYY